MCFVQHGRQRECFSLRKWKNPLFSLAVVWKRQDCLLGWLTEWLDSCLTDFQLTDWLVVWLTDKDHYWTHTSTYKTTKRKIWSVQQTVQRKCYCSTVQCYCSTPPKKKKIKRALNGSHWLRWLTYDWLTGWLNNWQLVDLPTGCQPNISFQFLLV